MPKPKEGESQKEFIARCIPYVAKEEPDSKSAYRVAKCYGIWRQHNKRKMPTSKRSRFVTVR